VPRASYFDARATHRVVEDLLTEEFCCEIALPRLAARRALVASGRLPDVPRESSERAKYERIVRLLSNEDPKRQRTA